MYKITWDKATGGIQLNLHVVENTLSVSPRPVFFEELDLLKLNEAGWTYPRCEEPIMWACNKQYYYRGDLLFEVSGANIYDAPTVKYAAGVTPGKLKSVNVKAMLQKNKDPLFLIESEAIDFIRDTYLAYSAATESFERVPANQIVEQLKERQEQKTKQKMAIVKQDCDSFDVMPLETAQEQGKRVFQTTKIDFFLASFSGGKDSQVVLDLCTRAIPPSAFQVIYSDTGYELPSSLALYKEVQKYYGEKFPDLRFSVAKNHAEVLDYWEKIGTPSDSHRWCCSVMKTVPLYRILKVPETNIQGKVMAFEGVRAEESTRRSGYARIGRGVKHSTVINASPILNWNTSEVFLYLFKYNLHMNQCYRAGMTRAGCLICPFSSEWNDMISNKIFPDAVQPFLTRIEKATEQSGIKDKDEYIKRGNWKRRGGGRDMKDASYMEVESNNPDLIITCVNPKKDLTTWFTAIGIYDIAPDGINGELKYKNTIYSFSIKKDKNRQIVRFPGTFKDPVFQGLVKRAVSKATYCINCEACEVECPTGAMYILPDARIDKTRCIHCQKCLMFHAHGCVVADSLTVTGNQNTSNMKLISYNNFGLNGDWLEFYMTSVDTYFEDNSHGLHPKEQLPSFVKWMVQAGIIDSPKTKRATPLGRKLSEVYIDVPDIVWQIVWINLSYNSPIARWYKEKVEWNKEFVEDDIRELVHADYPTDSPTTIKNIVYALFRTFNESPIGSMGLLQKVDTLTGRKVLYKKASAEDISREAIAYSLYKFAEEKGIRSFRIADLYSPDADCGIYKEFGITKSELEKALRSLNSDANRVLTAELNMGLDHITLRDDISSETVLNILL